jgi:hypothetical protein
VRCSLGAGGGPELAEPLSKGRRRADPGRHCSLRRRDLARTGSEGNHHDESVALAAETAAEKAAETSGEGGSGGGKEPAPAGEHSGGSEPSSKASETEAQHAAESGVESHKESDAKVLGINLESTPFVILAAIGSILLAAMVWTGRAPWIFILVALAMLAFAIFDIAEVFHQVDRGQGGIAALAGLVAAFHLAAGIGSAQLRREPSAP